MAKMKTLIYFERRANDLRNSNWDYKLIPFRDIVKSLMKDYRKENNISWDEYKPVFDKWFNKYHQ